MVPKGLENITRNGRQIACGSTRAGLVPVDDPALRLLDQRRTYPDAAAMANVSQK